jgi:hypothetical protein
MDAEERSSSDEIEEDPDQYDTGPDNGSSLPVKIPRRVTGKAIAVTGALLIGAVGVSLAGLAVVNNMRHQSHTTFCQTYKSALTQAMANPDIAADPSALAVLTPSDRSPIKNGLSAYQKQRVYSEPGQSANLKEWQSEATQFQFDALRRQGC